jgi:hypothetical protein
MQSLSGTTWKLVKASAFDDQGRELPRPLGPRPMGLVAFEAERMIGFVAAGNDRSSRPSDALAATFAAYSGTYSFDGTELVTSVDTASSPEMLRDQVRHVHFDSATRMTVTPKNPLLGRTAGLEFVWERIG